MYVNLYAGWRTENGFPVHWDDQDVLILQLEGRKHWKVWEPTRLYPFKEDVEVAPAPSGEPILDQILSKGDLLYLPRGWWHVVYPLDEPTLHLTVSIVNATGNDLLHWFIDRLKCSPECRMDLPHLEGPAHQQNYLDSLLSAINQNWSPDIMQTFMQRRDKAARVRPVLNFPFVPANLPLELGSSTVVRLETPRTVYLHDGPGGVEFEINGTPYHAPNALRGALELLARGGEYSLAEMAENTEEPALLRELLANLVKAGGLKLVEL